jgi:hypothetical protein
MENVDAGQFCWMARDTSEGVSWMIDDQPLTLLELLDFVGAAVSDWVVEQTLAVLWPQMSEIAALELDGDGLPESGTARELAERLEAQIGAAELTVLMEEFTRFGQAASTLMERMAELADGLGAEAGGEPGRRGAALRVVPPDPVVA